MKSWKLLVGASLLLMTGCGSSGDDGSEPVCPATCPAHASCNGDLGVCACDTGYHEADGACVSDGESDSDSASDTQADGDSDAESTATSDADGDGDSESQAVSDADGDSDSESQTAGETDGDSDAESASDSESEEGCAALNCGTHAYCEEAAPSCACVLGYTWQTSACTAGAILADGADLTLEADSEWNGADGSGGFTSGHVRFVNTYDTSYQSWDGFAYSNMTDTTTPDYSNQYSAMTGGALNPGIYMIAYQNTYATRLPTLSFPNGAATLAGLYVTNTAYGYYTLRDGNTYAKKFGGANGTDPDWFKLTIYALDAQGQALGRSAEVYLADYRADEAAQDYILREWTWVDLSSLGAVGGLSFEFASSDTGTYGINTPTYVALDVLMGQAR